MVGKLKLVLVAALILISLLGIATVYYFLQQERAMNASLDSALKNEKAQSSGLQAQLKESGERIVSLEQKIAAAEAEILVLSDTAEKEKKNAGEFQAKVSQLEQELEKQKNSGAELEGKVKSSQKEVEELSARIKSIEAEKSDLETRRDQLEAKVKDLEQQTKNIELGKIVVSSEAPSPLEPAVVVAAEVNPPVSAPLAQTNAAGANPQEAKVLIVNKDYNFVVLNLGSEDDVKVGDIFSLYQNDVYIGDVKVDKLHTSMSAAGFLSSDTKDKVGEGDRAVPVRK